MYLVSIEAEDCVGCCECANSCPSQIITMVDTKAQVTGDATECMGCESCVIVCDGGAVTVQEY